MSEVSEAIQAKCLAFGDRIIKLNDFLLEQAANKHQPSALSPQIVSILCHTPVIREKFGVTVK